MHSFLFSIRSSTTTRRSRSTTTAPHSAAGQPKTTSIKVTALDGIVQVNSIFTFAVFTGLAFATPDQRSLQKSSSCDAGLASAKSLIVFEVFAFSFFLFSSLVSQGLKLHMNLKNSNDHDEPSRADINIHLLKAGMFASAIGSVMGCLFLMLSMVNLIQIRLGTVSCGSFSTVFSLVALIILGASALIVYICTGVYAVFDTAINTSAGATLGG
ncbi:hypothetical protein Vadar_007534 [Vaccinium darrowii]|uniref:Uncharacterized protein n=1 Tax=Vaccinium darrowii TaxID=229202 RepID=A0ACB7X872_9ERIC|nr:hypothetical protein Vadar_007534 [Vaccinium darrowii]